MGTSAVIAAAVIGAGTAAYTADVQSKEAKAAREQAAKLAQKPPGAQAAKEAVKPKVDPRTMQGGSASPGAAAGTLLTGPQGVSTGSLNLGSSTLLGG